MKCVEVTDLVVRYEHVTALDGVSLDLAPGTALGIVGPNGSGKSTLLKAIAGLVRPTSGSVRVLETSPRALPPGTIGYVPQAEEVDYGFPVNVRDVVSMGRYPRLAPLAPFRAQDRRAVDDAIAALDLGALQKRRISELSGGQQRRTFVARAIAQQPKLLPAYNQVAVAVARGEQLVGVAANLNEYPLRVGQGAPIAPMFPPEGSPYTNYPMILLANAPHPHAAELLANWYLSKEGQKSLVEQRGAYSVRADVAPAQGNPPLAQLHPWSAGPVSLQAHDALVTEVSQILGSR